MSEVSERWHDWTYDGRGWYLVNDPEVTFYSEEEAMAYCDEHNRALVGQAAIEERAKIVAYLRGQGEFGSEHAQAWGETFAYQIEAGSI